MPKKSRNVRLLKDIRPERYELMLQPNLTEFSFYGQETAHLTLEKPTKEIVFHTRELEILSAQLIQARKSQSAKIKLDPKTETVKFSFTALLNPGKVQLKLTFKGTLNDKLRGFYRSKYIVNGRERYLATTQFESTDARQAFPCIDEPSAKAIFDVTLMIPGHTTAISNTIEDVVSEHESGLKIVKFAPTPKMSTYLLAFLVGEFEHLEDTTEEGVLVRVFTTPGKKAQAQFALDVATKTLHFYNQYFNIPYPLPVMDMIAVPDFSAGAMENWGAVTYRETALLIDAEKSSAGNRQRVALVVAHELAHMWFGDLVTMEWWTHLWLNEGFASYIEHLAVDHLFPEWDIWTQFVNSEHGRALKLDALANTHPIEIEVHHPDEISEIFDAVSYSKGASIIQMLAGYLGADKFRDGLRYYLNKHKYANASTIDLWNAFEHVSGQPVAKIMDNWTSKPGYPLLEVGESGQKLTISQSCFFSSALSKKQSKSNVIWSVPINLFGQSTPVQSHLLTKNVITLPKPDNTNWYKFNQGEVGFYRVKYSPRNLEALSAAVDAHQLGPTDRLGVLRDAFDLSEAGEISTNLALKLAKGFQSEDNYTVWAALSESLNQINDLLAGQHIQPAYQVYARQLFSEIAPKMGWTPKKTDAHTDTLLRNLALYSFGTYGDLPTIKHAQQLFQTSIKNKKDLPADIRGAVYNLVAENGGLKQYQQFKKKYSAETNQQERDRLTRALTRFKQPTLFLETFEFALSNEVRTQDAIFVLRSLVTNQSNRPLIWKHLKQNWPKLRDKYAGALFTLPRLIESLSCFNTKQELQEVETFFQKNPTPEATRTLAQTLEQIRSNIAWLARDLKSIEQFLKR